VDGDTALPNTAYGINAVESTDFVISSNTISGNTGSGIRMATGVSGFTVHSNRIGLGKISNIDLGNSNHGIYIDNSTDNLIGNASTSSGIIVSGLYEDYYRKHFMGYRRIPNSYLANNR
jgi:parallel beta-helix repeat protein